MTLRLIPAAFIAALLAFGAAAADYPSRPIRVIVPFSAGSASDIIARLVAPKLNESWGQPVVIDNRPSAGGTVAGAIVASSDPDGYTLLFTSSGFAGSAALYEKLPYDPVRDFSGVTLLAVTPLVLIVAPTLGPKSVKELIALARQNPGKVNFGSSGIGSGTHFAGELFKLAAGINTVHVPYRGTPEATTDTMSGRIQYFISPVLPVVPLIRSGRVLALGVTSAHRLPMLQDVPTIAEAAIPGFEYEGWYGVFVASRTPRIIVNHISREVGRSLLLPDVYEKISSTGAVPRPTTPEEFDRKVRAEIAMRAKIFKASGAKAD
jgi:tripartite-type tricarboxylate transporter receptor subunit TctC